MPPTPLSLSLPLARAPPTPRTHISGRRDRTVRLVFAVPPITASRSCTPLSLLVLLHRSADTPRMGLQGLPNHHEQGSRSQARRTASPPNRVDSLSSLIIIYFFRTFIDLACLVASSPPLVSCPALLRTPLQPRLRACAAARLSERGRGGAWPRNGGGGCWGEARRAERSGVEWSALRRQKRRKEEKGRGEVERGRTSAAEGQSRVTSNRRDETRRSLR